MLKKARCTEDTKQAGTKKNLKKTTFGQKKRFPRSSSGSYFNLHFNIKICVRRVNIFFTNVLNIKIKIKSHSWAAGRKAELHLHSSAVLLFLTVQIEVCVWTKAECVDPQSSDLHSTQWEGVCVYMCDCMWYSCVHGWMCVWENESMFVRPRPENSSLHMFRRLRLRRWAGPLGRASRSAISRASGWSSPPAPRTHTERRPGSSHLILQCWEKGKKKNQNTTTSWGHYPLGWRRMSRIIVKLRH